MDGIADVSQEFSALAAPVAQYTWAIAPVTLLNTQDKTAIIPVRFSRPVEILGFDARVIPKLPLAGSLAIPTVDVIDVYIDLDQAQKFTSQVDDEGPATGFVPLASVLTSKDGGARLVRIQPNAPSPDFQFQFAWRQFIAGTPLYEGAIISLAMYARYVGAAK